MLTNFIILVFSTFSVDLILYGMTVLPVGLVFLAVMAYYDFKTIPYCDNVIKELCD